MRGNLAVLVSAPLILAILLPTIAVYALSVAVYVALVNPLGHCYRIVRYGIQSDEHQLA